MKKCIAYFFTIFLFASCTEREKVKTLIDVTKTTFPPPVTFLLDTMPQPKRVDLKNMLPPLVIKVPETADGFYTLKTESGKEKIQLSPPITTMAGAPVPYFTNFNSDSGLADNNVMSSWMDPKGNLWVGTHGGGVSRYNGMGFVNFNSEQGLPHPVVRSIMGDNNGNIWFGMEGGGVSRYDGVSFKTFSTREGLADSTVLTILCDKKGTLWFGTNKGGVSKFDGKVFNTLDSSDGLPMNNVNTLFEDRKGNIWIGTYGGGVCRYNPTNGKTGLSIYTMKQGLANNYIISITEDTKGNLWFGTDGGGVSRFDGHTFKNFTKEQGLAENIVNCIVEDDQGNLWMGTHGGGLSRFDGKNFVNFKKSDGLADEYIWCCTKDRLGKIWFGTTLNGLSCYNGSAFTIFNANNSIFSNYVSSIVQDKTGSLWFAQLDKGVSRYDGSHFTTYTTSQGLGHNRVMTITLTKNGIFWIGTYGGGVSRYDGKQLTTYTTDQGLANNIVQCILEDRKGNIWIGTFGGGVSRFDTSNGMAGFTTYTSGQGLAHDEIRCIEEGPDGDIWFGTDGGGVSRFDREKFTTYNTGNGLAKNDIYAIKQDRSGNLWFGTVGGGISRFDGTGFTSFSTRDGLSSDIVNTIVEDEAGVLWIGTNQGFSGLKFKMPKQGNEAAEIKGAGLLKVSNEILQTYEPAWEIYNSKTGYPLKEMNVMEMTKLGLPKENNDDVGVIWGGLGDSKVIRFDPNAVDKNTDPPSVFIQSVKVDETTLNWYGLRSEENDRTVVAQQEAMVFGKHLSLKTSDSLKNKFGDIQFDSITPFYQVPQNLLLPYRHNRISFDFGAIETNRNFMVRYQFILEGYDKEWSPITEKSSASFGNISEGAYTFKIKARSPEGVWSEPIIYNFKVMPPWWRTWWAYISYLLLFSLSMYAIFHWRTKSLKQEKIILEEKVSQRTQQLEQKSSELEQSLESLKSTQTQLVQSEKMASLGELTAGIAHEIQNPLNFVNNFSDVNQDLIDELNEENERGNSGEVKIIAGYIKENEAKINQHGKRADAIVKGMLQHSRVSAGIKEPTDINALADEYLRLSYHGLKAKDKSFNATMLKDFDENIGKINIIPQDIGRVLLNLYNNAFYAVSAETLLKVNGNFEPTVSVSSKKIGDKIEIRVKDNGTGIPEKIQSKIFQPFFTTKPTGQGTGLGLSLSYDIVKAHGGEIKVESKEGEGTEFKIILPV